MNENYPVKKMIRNIVIFMALIAVVFYFLLREHNINEIISTIKSVNLTYIYIGIVFVFLYLCIEAIIIGRTLVALNHKVKAVNAFKYSCAGFFFSAITPLAVAGQPMQIYYIKKDGIEVAHGSLAILLEVAVYQFVTLITAIISYFFNYEFIMNSSKFIKIFIVVGIVANASILTFIMLSMFSNKLTMKIIKIVFAILGKIKFLKTDKVKVKVEEQIKKYNRDAKFVKENPMHIVVNVLLMVLQISFMYSIPFLIYKAFGLNELSFFKIYTLQSVLSVAVSVIPIPGGVGASESGFLLLFKTLFPKKFLSSAMLLNRGVSFYLYILITGIFIMSAEIVSKNKIKE